MARTKKTVDTQSSPHEAAHVEHSKQLPRLRRIAGQVGGVQKMIESKRDCVDIAHQISAIINALRRVQNDMLHDHLGALGEQIIAEDMTPQKRRALADEISRHLKTLS